MGTVGSAALLGGLVDLDVLDDQGTGVEALGIGVGLGVLEELEQELGGLDGPPGAGHTPLLAYLLSSVSLPNCTVCKVRFIHDRMWRSFVVSSRDRVVFYSSQKCTPICTPMSSPPSPSMIA